MTNLNNKIIEINIVFIQTNPIILNIQVHIYMEELLYQFTMCKIKINLVMH